MTLPAGAALGSTKDPRALIRGEASQVHATATALTAEAARIDGLASAFAGVRVEGWEGGVGQAAYAAKQAAERAKWTMYADVLAKAGSAMSTYAGALTTAQSRAADAIAKWEEGKQATLEAKRAYNAAARAYNASLRSRATVTTPGAPAGPAAQAARPASFVDPGVDMRKEAQQILHDARQSLDAAGGAAIVGLGGAPASGGGASGGGPDASATANRDASIKWSGFEKTFGTDPTKGADGKFDSDEVGAKPTSKFSKGDRPEEQPGKDSKFTFNLGSAQAQATAWGADTSTEAEIGPLKVGAGASATAGQVSAEASGHFGRDGVSAKAGAKVVVLSAEAKAKAELGPASAEVAANASAGANADAAVKVTPTSVHADGAMFAGGKAGITAAPEVGPVKAEAGAEVQAGVGMSGGIDYGYDDGKVTLGGSGGLALGFGGKLSYDVTIDLGKAKDTLGDAAGAIGGIFS